MSVVEQVVYEALSAEAKEAYNQQVQENGYITNMKLTLLQSLPSFHALMQWYPLRSEVLQFISPRSFVIFCYAISSENDCLICATFFRKEMADLGSTVEELQFTEEEILLVEFGQALVKNPKTIVNQVFENLKERYSEEQVVALTAFGAMMVATNLINNVLDVELDERLVGYLAGGKAGQDE